MTNDVVKPDRCVKDDGVVTATWSVRQLQYVAVIRPFVIQSVASRKFSHRCP